MLIIKISEMFFVQNHSSFLQQYVQFLLPSLLELIDYHYPLPVFQLRGLRLEKILKRKKKGHEVVKSVLFTCFS